MRTQDYLNLVASHGLLPAHTLPTHSKTCIDHVLLKTRLIATTVVIESTVTDHCAVMVALNKALKTVESTRTKINYDQLNSLLREIDFTNVYGCSDANVALEQFTNLITRAIATSSSTYQVPHRLKILKPWITPGILRCMKNRDRLYIKTKRAPNNEILKITYKRYREYCNILLKNLKRQYETSELNKVKSNPKRIWNLIKDVTHIKKSNPSANALLKSSSICDSINEINETFINTGRKIAEDVSKSINPTLNVNTQPSKYIPNSLAFLETDAAEVERLILSLRSNCAVGVDGISSNILKQYRSILVLPLTHIFNLAIRNGVFPHLLKKALVYPIYKAGDRESVLSYRPISVLTSLSKILEKNMNTQLIKFLDANNILSDNQYGFRSHLSANDAVHNLTSRIVDILDKGEKCIGIFLDLAKAFDTLSIPVLISKLERIGVRGLQLKLFQSYLTDRTQCVKIGEHRSDYLLIEHGVPQGSILGPTLFLIYINDMCELNMEHGKLFAYADDTALVFSGGTWDQAFNVAQRGFDRITNWLTLNCLSLNIDKTKYMTFSMRALERTKNSITAHKHLTSTSSSCKCLNIHKVGTIRYLGVTLDERLTFSAHIELLSGRIRKLIYVFKHLRHIAEPQMLKMVYFALCQSLLGYCIMTWGGAPKTHLLQLERAQRAVLKVATCKPFRSPTKELYEYCGVLTVRQLFILEITLKQHTLQSKFNQSLLTSNQISARRYKLPPIIPRRTTFGQRFFNYLGNFIYSKVIKLLPPIDKSRHTFKLMVSEWLKNQSYDETEHLLHQII